MKQTKMIFNTEMVRALLEGRKTMTRRIIKKQPIMLVRLDNEGIFYEESKLRERGETCRDTSITKFRLHGRDGREYLFEDAIRRVWEEGVRGLVSIERGDNEQGLSLGFFMPSKQESDQGCTSSDLHVISRDAGKEVIGDSAHGRRSEEQQTRKSEMGNTSGELAGQETTRTQQGGRGSSCISSEQRGTQTHSMGCKEQTSKHETSGPNPWRFFHSDPYSSKWELGQLIWVRESFGFIDEVVFYKADDSDKPKWFESPDLTRSSPIHMPRKASRLTLKINDVRVERVQDISEEDAVNEGLDVFNEDGNLWYSGWMEGADSWYENVYKWHCNDPVQAFKELWDSINFKKGNGWATDPWVWVISFEVIKQNIGKYIESCLKRIKN